MIGHNEYSKEAVEDIVRLRRVLDDANIPSRRTDHNIIVGTWNIQHFGRLHKKWDENPKSPKRNLRSLAIIAEIIRRYDVIAIQEVKRNTQALRILLREFLGSHWGMMLSDVSAGSKGNSERLAYVYDKRRVIPSGLAGEIVLVPPDDEDTSNDGAIIDDREKKREDLSPVIQFDRTPYIVGFQAADERFALLTVHIRYGENEKDRLEEIQSLSRFVVEEIRDQSRFADAEETNLILLGDFNINERTEDNILFRELLNAGLWIPENIHDVKTTYGTEAKHYDQIAWFRDDFAMLGGHNAGVIDFAGAVYPELSSRQMSFRVSDHFPLWVEFLTDRSVEAMAINLGIDPANPNPFAGIE